MSGRSVDEYRAPLFLAWQLTNRCGARCIACCEESGPDKAWGDELRRDEALDLARRVGEFGIPYAAFGGGEPLGVPHCWELFEVLAGERRRPQDRDRRQPHRRRPPRTASRSCRCGASRSRSTARRPPRTTACVRDRASRRPSARSSAWPREAWKPQFVFVPTRFNLHEIVAAFDLAASLGCGAFVTGPLMRLGRAAHDWQRHRLQRRGLAAGRGRAARARGVDAAPRWRCRSIPGTSSPRSRRGSNRRRRCCWSCRTGRSSSSMRCRSRPPTCGATRSRRRGGRIARPGARRRCGSSSPAAAPIRALLAPRQRDVGDGGAALIRRREPGRRAQHH